MELEQLFCELVEAIRSSDPGSLHQPHRLRDIQYDLVPYRRVRHALGLECSEDHEMLLLCLCDAEAGYFQVSDPDASRALADEIASSNPDLSLLEVYGDIEIRLVDGAITRALEEPRPMVERAYQPPSGDAAEPATDQSRTTVLPFAPPTREEEEEEGGDEAMPKPPPVPEPVMLHYPGVAEETGPESGEEDADERGAADRPSGPELVEDTPDGEPRPESDEPPTISIATGIRRPESAPGARPTPPPFEIAPAHEERSAEGCAYCGGALPADRRANFCPHCGQNLNVIRCADCGAELEYGWRHCINCGHPVPPA